MGRFLDFLKKFKKSVFLVVFLILIYNIIPLPDNLFTVDNSVVVTDKDGKILRVFLNKNEQWYFPPDPEVKLSKKLTESIINFEDKYFYYHPGVNPFSLLRAFVGNLTSWKVKSGASTISMQVIRIALKKKRTLFNKIIEIFQALKLEIKYSKKEILKMYVDNAPYGGNIIGITAASLRYFNKTPVDLTWNEAALLAVLPNSPGLISPVLDRDELIRKKNRLLKKMVERGIISEDIYTGSISEDVPSGIVKFPILAPHFAEFLKSKYGNRKKLIRSTINKDFQIRIEGMLKQHLNYLGTVGIKNGSVVVAETGTGKIVAYSGSQDFFNNKLSGQVDGARASRSTGSILKPFLYALAIDEGLILERTLLKDIPSYFGSFSPSNASRIFSGVVTAKEALIRSLNVPAVRLLNRFGLHKFYLFLRRSGLTSLVRNPDDYGLTLILGGAESRLIDLVKMYRGLGNYGRFSPLQYVVDYKEEGVSDELISGEASYLTLQMLKELKRPGAEYYWEQYQRKTPIAWKTGTSYGQRDAWAVGVSPEWTIGVWIGNFTGEGNLELVGSSSAAPLMFDIFNYLPKKKGKEWFDKDNLKFKKVVLCRRTGYVAGDSCEDTIEVDSPISAEVVSVCPYHTTIYVTTDEKFSVCSLCWEDGNYKTVKKLIFPPDVSQFLRNKGDIVDSVPPHKKNCPSGSGSNSIRILYPVKNARILIPVDFNKKVQNITIRVAHKFKKRKIFWYIDKEYKGVTEEKHKKVITLSPGWHHLEVIDSYGNRAGRKFFISFTNHSK